MTESEHSGLLKAMVLFARAVLVSKAHSVVENVALRQQLAVVSQSVKGPKLRSRDRVFSVWLSRLWPNWQSALSIVQPDTVKALQETQGECHTSAMPAGAS